jgi:hypothetical protein
MNKRRSEHLNEYAAFTGNIFLFRKKKQKNSKYFMYHN